jgi:atypical dual specificity phosphatase
MVRNFEFMEPGEVAISAVPETAEMVDWLYEQGVRSVVSTHPVPEAAQERMHERGIAWCNFPIVDFAQGVPEGFSDVLAFIRKQRAEGSAVLIHCAGGGGRSRTMYAAHRMQESGWSSERALAQVPGIEKDAQRAFLHGFAAGLN